MGQRPAWLPPLSRDGWLLFGTCGVRNFAYGFVSVIFGLHLATLGLDAPAIGAVFTSVLAGGALMTVALTQVADQVGRRRVLVLGAALMAMSGVVLAVTQDLVTLTVAAMLGAVSPSGKEVGPFQSLEQAVLPQTTRDEDRTKVFAAYNVIASLAGAFGALIVGLPDLLGQSPTAGYLALLWGYAVAGLLLLVLFGRLSSAVEVKSSPRSPSTARRWLGLERSRGIVLKLVALIAVDTFATGFVVQGLLAYWFSLRFGADPATVGLIFFGTNLFTAVSFLAAVPLARRIGLLRTMVFTHLPSNVLLMLVPLMPGLESAVMVLLVRHLLSQMDVPTRQSYTMAIVDPEERSATAGLISVGRNVASAAAPALAGAAMAVPGLGLPFFIAGGLKIAYDLTIFALFRSVRPPEETEPGAMRTRGQSIGEEVYASNGGGSSGSA